MGKSGAYTVQPLSRALGLLTKLGEVDRPIGLSELAKLADIPKATAFRYLRTLNDAGFVHRDLASDTYTLGGQVHILAKQSRRVHLMMAYVRPHLERLRGQVNEAVNFGVLDKLDIVHMEVLEPRRNLRIQASVGWREPAWETALGRALLAPMSPAERRIHLPKRLMGPDGIPVTHAALDGELDQVRAQNIAIVRGTSDDDVSCIGTPVYERPGVPFGAISLTVPTFRFADELIATWANALQEAATTATAELAELS